MIRILMLCAALLPSAVPAVVHAAGVDTSSEEGSSDPALDGVRQKIKTGDYQGALADLRGMPPSADVYNLMGYSSRKSRNYGQAQTYYQQALRLDPKHKQALEYQGELFVETGQMQKARENVATLRALCPSGCEELSDLEGALAKAPSGVSTR